MWNELIEEDKSFIPDKWQQEVLDFDGNTVLRTGRQVGKSTIISRKAGKFAIKNPGTTTLIIAAAQRQSSLLFDKTLIPLSKIHEKLIKNAQQAHKKEWAAAQKKVEFINRFRLKYGLFAEIPTRTKIKLKNGSEIYSLPAGKSGAFIRGFSLDLLIADEAAYIPESVWVAVKPMIAVSRKMKQLGWVILLSTPFGKGGYFYDCCHDADFKHWHVSSESCNRIPRDFLKKERQKLTRIEYAQEYLGEFVEEFNQLFSTELIKKRMTFIEWDGKIKKDCKYFLGVDVARYGADESAFVIAEMNEKGKLRIVMCNTTERKSITDSAGRIKALDEKFNFTKIFIDSAGVGGGLYDIIVEKVSKKRVIGLENAKRTIDKEGRKGKIFKEDLYSNAIVLIEKEPSCIDIISDLALLKSLKCMTFEYTSQGNLRIFGNYSHLAEAFVRAVWCVKSKHLNLFCA